MTFRQRTLCLLGMAMLLAPMSSGSALAQVPVGPFTQAQATAGHDAFIANCSRCHGANLRGGGGGPNLTGTHFYDSWGAETTKDLYQFISTRMPYNRPGSLSEETYTNIVGFILSVNNARPGATAFNKTIAVKIGAITDIGGPYIDPESPAAAGLRQ